MVEQDYLTRMINDIARLLAKMLLKKDSISYELPDESEFTQTDYLYNQLGSLINEGKLNEAENLLLENMDINNNRYFELALDFYIKLNNLNEEYLEENNYTREEIEYGVKELAKAFGMNIP